MKSPRSGIALACLAVGILSGCTSSYVARSLLCDETNGGKATSRAAKCMTAAAYEIAKEKAEASQDQAKAGKADKGDNAGIASKYERRIP